MTNRADLFWALTAALPHAGSHLERRHVNLEASNGMLHVHATDGYTIGIARLSVPSNGTLSLSLDVSEAKELRRFIKPQLVRHRSETVEMLDAGNGELHLATAEDSAVFECGDVYAPLSLHRKMAWIGTLESSPTGLDEWLAQPSLMSRFADAQRTDTDRMRLYARKGVRLGVAVVTVGEDFLGAVAGLEFDDVGEAILSSWLGVKVKAA